MSRRSLALFGVIAVSWIVLAWFVFNWLLQTRITALVEHETKAVRQDLSQLSENFERVLSRLQGLPAVLATGRDVADVLASFGPTVAPSSQSRDAVRAAWTQRADLLALDRQLLGVAGEMDVDVIWVLNASGDCVAASNFGETTSLIATNYADRSYFKSAQAGKRGRQYALGRVTNVPGLFFSAPVTAQGQFLGAVAIKIDLPRLAPWFNHQNAFVTDEYGVVILAADQAMEMRALPGATVYQLPVAQRMERYKREAFETLRIGVGAGPGGLVRVADSPYPYIAARSDRPQHGIAVHILAPIEGIDSMRRDAFAAFLLLAFSGIMMTALAFGVRAYLSRVRQHRESMEATNASLNELNQNLNHLARMDPLTDCSNRRHFQACLEAEIARGIRYGREFSLLIGDIDHFKEINDRHGHAAGDEALRHLVRIIRQQLRNQDELGRMGGEEFAVLLPETGQASAAAAAERIRRAVETTPAQYENAQIPMTVSFGVACWKSSAESADALLRRADTALYAAKSAGRNRVASADDTVDGKARVASVAG
ncbi:MAG TPA: diguanylate cyclase [Burkholderiales bacterium]|nr:diguanylate cyclase [Burkholderiales bacterium]